MSHKLSFGQYEGRTFEWVFFNAPWYAEWIYDNGIYRQAHNFSEEEGDCFRELYRRSRSITKTCTRCNQRPISRLGMTWQRNGNLGAVGFFCEECEYQGGSTTAYHPSRFFVDAHTITRDAHLRITGEIKRIWIGDGRLTQKKMEEFFQNDAFFPAATPGFFVNRPAPE